MKIGCLDIRKAYLGSRELTATNAFLGTTPIISSPQRDYLTFVCVEDGSIGGNMDAWIPNIEYSKNDSAWQTWDFTDIPLSFGDVVKMRGVNPHGLAVGAGYTLEPPHSFSFSMTGKIAAHGNVMSLIDGQKDGTKVIPHGTFYWEYLGMEVKEMGMIGLFGTDGLITAPELPATTLGEGCYANMFSYCSDLTTAPYLPATTLAPHCYQLMFAGCTSLVNVPDLPATTLADSCYNMMFYECTSLVKAPALPATTLAVCCYGEMFEECTSLTIAPELPADILEDNCYQLMFARCVSLVNAPELPATKLAYSCYSMMFFACDSLVTAPALPVTTLAESCYDYMFYWCENLVNAPELPATTLVKDCYEWMFKNCTSLNNLKCLATDLSAENCLTDWTKNTAATGTFTKAAGVQWPSGDSGIPSGWTVIEQ